MAEQALRVRVAANENLHKELESLQQERRKVGAEQAGCLLLASKGHIKCLMDAQVGIGHRAAVPGQPPWAKAWE